MTRCKWSLSHTVSETPYANLCTPNMSWMIDYVRDEGKIVKIRFFCQTIALSLHCVKGRQSYTSKGDSGHEESKVESKEARIHDEVYYWADNIHQAL